MVVKSSINNFRFLQLFALISATHVSESNDFKEIGLKTYALKFSHANNYV